MRSGVTVGYSGIHQAYQLARAAEEAGVLETFYCSIFDAPGKWGGMLSRIFGSDALVNRRVDGVPVDKVVENPWPLLSHRLRARVRPGTAHDTLAAQESFDRWVASELDAKPSSLFVGTETCAQRSFEVCARRKIVRILDCPQLHPQFLISALGEASERLKLPGSPHIDTPGMAARKADEFASADWLLVYSEVHRRSFLQAGIRADRLFECPLWVDSGLWFPEPGHREVAGQKLRVLFVGSINLRKGVPFLLEAACILGDAVELTLVGTVAGEIEALLRGYQGPLQIVAPQTKAALRATFSEHDVLVLPSIADSFGFVGLEAMACGLPVVVTENCGVPVPHASWRVPVMDPAAIAARLEHYLRDRESLRADREEALTFAANYTPARYRAAIAEFFKSFSPASEPAPPASLAGHSLP